MVEHGRTAELNGYVYCMFRVLEKRKAWSYIREAFSAAGQNIPTQYYTLFGYTPGAEHSPEPPFATEAR
jgi:hypothetical protein